jgi:hypothetical protein
MSHHCQSESNVDSSQSPYTIRGLKSENADGGEKRDMWFVIVPKEVILARESSSIMAGIETK